MKFQIIEKGEIDRLSENDLSEIAGGSNWCGIQVCGGKACIPDLCALDICGLEACGIDGIAICPIWASGVIPKKQ